jgi:hypothetical protein
MIAEPHIDQSDIGISGRILVRLCLQALDYVFGFALAS